MVKWIGGGLILLAGFLNAYDFRTKQKAAIKDLRFYCELAEHIRMQIEYFALPLSKILKDYSGLDDKTPSDILKTLEKKNSLTEAEKKIIFDWISHLGVGYKDEQLKRCAYAKEKLGQLLESRLREYPSKVKVNNALSFLGGASLILLLL